MKKELAVNLKYMASSQELVQLFAPQEPAIATRLIHFSMDEAWVRIDALCDGDIGVIDNYFYTALGLRKRWQRMHKVSSKVIDANVNDIAACATDLANKVLAYADDLKLATGIEQQQHDEIVRIAKAYSKRLKTSGATADYLHRPTKVGAATAERTFCVRVLTAFLYEQTGNSDHQAVADTVTAILDLGAANPLTRDDAGKAAKNTYT